MKPNGLQENTVQLKGRVSHSKDTSYKAYPSTKIDTTSTMILFIKNLKLATAPSASKILLKELPHNKFQLPL